MNKSELLKLVVKSFEFNTNEDTLHACSDGVIFSGQNLSAAKNHSARHKDELTVTTFKREEVMGNGVNESDDTETSKPLSKMNLTELKAFATEKGIELEATKKADIVEEITTKLVAKSEDESEDSPKKTTESTGSTEEE